MKLRLKQKIQGGYTIIEVMMVLIVTGTLLSIVGFSFMTQQNRTGFKLSINETDARLRTIVNEVASGYYPNKGDIRCRAPASGAVQLENSNRDQGSNQGCIFIGRTLQFSKSSDFQAYTIVGRQRVSGTTDEVTTLAAAFPKLVVSETGEGVDNTEKYSMPWGVHPYKIVAPGVCGDASGFSVVTTLASYTLEQINSGSQSFDLIPLCVPLDDDFNVAGALAAVSNLNDTDRSASSVIVCVKSGDDQRRGAFEIGTNSNKLYIRTLIDSNVPVECNE